MVPSARRSSFDTSAFHRSVALQYVTRLPVSCTAGFTAVAAAVAIFFVAFFFFFGLRGAVHSDSSE